MTNDLTIPYDWLRKKFIPVFLKGLRRDKIKYKLVVFDCDQYSRRFQVELLKDISQFGFTSKSKRPILFIITNQAKKFGGVHANRKPIDPPHKFVKVFTKKGWIAVEPQTGYTSLWEKYPNKNNIILTHL